MEYRWGDVVVVDFGEVYGSEQGGIRPAVVVQNDDGNRCSSTTIVLPLTTQNKHSLPTHSLLTVDETRFLLKNSLVVGEQIRTVDRTRISRKIGDLSYNQMQRINYAVSRNFQSQGPKGELRCGLGIA